MPKRRIIRKIVEVPIKNEEGAIFKIMGEGISKIISISKTRKITASKKNRVEKGKRALSLGSNPHSKGVDFSRSFSLRALKVYARLITNKTSKIEIKEVMEKIDISHRT